MISSGETKMKEPVEASMKESGTIYQCNGSITIRNKIKSKLTTYSS